MLVIYFIKVKMVISQTLWLQMKPQQILPTPSLFEPTPYIVSNFLKNAFISKIKIQIYK